jgi:hypothetical protein
MRIADVRPRERKDSTSRPRNSTSSINGAATTATKTTASVGIHRRSDAIATMSWSDESSPDSSDTSAPTTMAAPAPHSSPTPIARPTEPSTRRGLITLASRRLPTRRETTPYSPTVRAMPMVRRRATSALESSVTRLTINTTNPRPIDAATVFTIFERASRTSSGSTGTAGYAAGMVVPLSGNASAASRAT